MNVDFLLDGETAAMGMRLYPASMKDRLVARRTTLGGSIDAELCGFDLGSAPAYFIEPLVQLSLVGDVQAGGFSAGHTMRNASSTGSLKFRRQDTREENGTQYVCTTLGNDDGLEAVHCLSWRKSEDGLRAWTEVTHAGAEPVTLQMVTSFNLGEITPFAADDAPERLWIHRFRSAWSVEGRHEVRRVEELELERSWNGCSLRCERFGQVGSMPVRKWFPFVAVEDRTAGVFWGAQLAWSGSWQMEMARIQDTLCLSGGLADREFGHWMKQLQPGETFTTPMAFLSCAIGDIDDLCFRLTGMQHAAADLHPGSEHDLPAIFNEWCTSWGDPTHDKLVAIADKLQGTATRYLVIDAGWFVPPGGSWGADGGDWVPSKDRFPHGLKATCDAIRERGLVPGLWFELEVIGRGPDAEQRRELHLTRDGELLKTGIRGFWDMRKEAAHAYLEERVIDLMDACGIGYIKVDYNDSIGIGVDGAESLGEGLRQCIEGTHRFFRRMRERLPDLVIESCSSGGHRLEPAMISLTAMSSFSDCHEGWDIPIIAANVQRLLLPRQSQIWAVLHPGEPEHRTVYSLAATFLGRMCVSGEICDVSEAQMEWIRRAQNLYEASVPVIKTGLSRRYGPTVISNRYPKGWQAVVREGTDRRLTLVVAHRFEDEMDDIVCPLPEGTWRIANRLMEGATTAALGDSSLRISGLAAFSGAVFLLTSG